MRTLMKAVLFVGLSAVSALPALADDLADSLCQEGYHVDDLKEMDKAALLSLYDRLLSNVKLSDDMALDGVDGYGAASTRCGAEFDMASAVLQKEYHFTTEEFNAINAKHSAP